MTRLLTYLLLGGLVTGCDDNTIISPFSGRDAHFSMYGYISTSDTQLVRIVPIRSGLDRDDSPVELRATVTTTETRSGRVDTWQPVLRFLDDGSRGLPFSDSTFGHVYRAIFTPNPGEEYQIEVTSFDGRTSRASATVPRVGSTVPGPYTQRAGGVVQEVFLPGVNQQPFQVLSLYFVSSTVLRPQIFIIPIQYEGEGMVTEDGLVLEVNLNDDVQRIRRHIVENLSQYATTPVLEDPLSFPLFTSNRRIRVAIGDSAWNFIGRSTSEISQPGAVSNVENGFGYFGALGTSITDAPITDASIRTQIGFSF